MRRMLRRIFSKGNYGSFHARRADVNESMYVARGDRFPIDEHPFPSLTPKIGLLPLAPLAGFYSFVKGIVQDILAIL